jgi:Tfp pilus assembly protein PilN
MRRVAVVAALVMLTALGAAQLGFAQPAEDVQNLRKDVETLEEGQKAIQSDLQDIKNLLKARPTTAARAPVPQEVVLSLAGAPTKGDGNAKVVLVDFTDYQ